MKRTLHFIMVALVIYGGWANSALAVGDPVSDGNYDGCTITSTWHCSETNISANPQEKDCSATFYQTAGDNNDLSDYVRNGGSTFSERCAIGCPNPVACGKCECRCDGSTLKCADRWIDNGYAVARVCDSSSFPNSGLCANAACGARNGHVYAYTDKNWDDVTYPPCAKGSELIAADAGTWTFLAPGTTKTWQCMSKTNEKNTVSCSASREAAPIIPSCTIDFSPKSGTAPIDYPLTVGMSKDADNQAYCQCTGSLVPKDSKGQYLSATTYSQHTDVAGDKSCTCTVQSSTGNTATCTDSVNFAAACVSDTCAANTCTGQTCWNGCATVNGTKNCPSAPTCNLYFEPGNLTAAGDAKLTVKTTNATSNSIFCTGPGTSGKTISLDDGTYSQHFDISQTGTKNCDMTVSGPGGSSICNGWISVAAPPGGGATCGPNAKNYASTDTTWPTIVAGSFCATGDGVGTAGQPTFPSANNSVSWTCLGSSGGANTTCTAMRAAVGCTADCSCAANTCSGETCGDGCGGFCNGARGCSKTGCGSANGQTFDREVTYDDALCSRPEYASHLTPDWETSWYYDTPPNGHGWHWYCMANGSDWSGCTARSSIINDFFPVCGEDVGTCKKGTPIPATVYYCDPADYATMKSDLDREFAAYNQKNADECYEKMIDTYGDSSCYRWWGYGGSSTYICEPKYIYDNCVSQGGTTDKQRPKSIYERLEAKYGSWDACGFLSSTTPSVPFSDWRCVNKWGQYSNRCTIAAAEVNCGSAADTPTPSKPLYNLCSSGSEVWTDPNATSGKYEWTCGTKSCSATKQTCTCIADPKTTCIGSMYNNTCSQKVCPGTKDCRDLNWREVAPN